MEKNGELLSGLSVDRDRSMDPVDHDRPGVDGAARLFKPNANSAEGEPLLALILLRPHTLKYPKTHAHPRFHPKNTSRVRFKQARASNTWIGIKLLFCK